ncbi:leucine rich repeat-containing protein [Toxoplasma gondii GAB2-2007-GAL-DOM2]|uniref:Leucine rich repeat-containing protein n=6 Tax=Toxoplasma gondii TaxID=5811 RepID=S7VWB5_TOXGG|nr:leucine rich repeat-containing protein [Toxoplasma gondii GT1]KAF4643950.1 leucine rich repeat-containing protein [Toxoplasma gondii]KFG30160.1 leucine rich repeat-containing protein [Toxoplasma gondii GAB2-2007-GAL-DOM2]KFG54638.1 leucine rich repeat-containing protein [Toxoplasma gondii FOU]PUA87910.1 leucine rich repeat-containing protein [Toxoplasma gondii TgCATBr9]RQX67091.1 leucine rich repeat-containing protein [Toxoplasma gondii CAST]
MDSKQKNPVPRREHGGRTVSASSHSRWGSTGIFEAACIDLGPVLTREKLTGLLLAAVPKKIKGVKVLDLSQNNIRKLSVSLGEIAELGLESVEELILRGNLLRQLDGKLLTFPCLARLDVSENILAQVINFETQFELRELSLYQNRLRDINGLGRTPLHRTLERLDVSRNDIPDLRGLAALVTLEKLKELDVRDNPVESHPLQGNVVLEGFCMLACPLLETLNGHPVTENVRDAVICWSSDDARGRAVASCVYRFRQAFSTRGMDGLDLSGEEVAGPFGSLEEPTYDDRTASHSKTEETCLSQRAISSRSRTVTRGPGSRHQCREEGENLGRCVFAREYRDARENFRLLSPEECVDTDPAASWPAADRGWRPSPRRFISPAQVAPTAGPERARPLSEGRPFAGPPRNGSEIFRSTYSERCRLYPSPSSVSRRPPQRKRQEICPRGWPQRASRVTKATQTPGWWRPNDWEVPGEEATGRRRLAGRREGDDNGLARWATSSVASGDFQFFIKANDVGPPVSAEELRALQAGKKGAGSEAHIVLAGNRNEENEMYQTEGVQEESLPSDWVRQPAYRDYAFQQDAESLDGRQMLYYVPEGKAYSVTSSPTHVFQNDERYPMHNGDVFELTQDSDSPDDGVEGRREIGI